MTREKWIEFISVEKDNVLLSEKVRIELKRLLKFYDEQA